MTGVDIVFAVAAVAISIGCLGAVLRITSGVGRLGLLLVLLVAILVGLGVQPPGWYQIADYLAPNRTEVDR